MTDSTTQKTADGDSKVAASTQTASASKPTPAVEAKAPKAKTVLRTALHRIERGAPGKDYEVIEPGTIYKSTKAEIAELPEDSSREPTEAEVALYERAGGSVASDDVLG